MRKHRVIDEPISRPSEDLLGMSEYAHELAVFLREVPPPFTIGVFGEWGAGKTSLVRLLEYYLKSDDDKDETVFIRFSAWPFSTSDSLWRALIIEIAKGLYGVDVADDSEDGDDQQSLRDRMVNLLKSDALVIEEAQQEPDPLADYQSYKSFITLLDRTVKGSISKDEKQQVRINQETGMTTIVHAAVSVLR